MTLAPTDVGIVVVGGSLAAAKTLQALRERGYRGPLTLISDESVLPYDRPPLSKEFLAGRASEDDLRLLPDLWYAEHDVRVLLGAPATGLDLDRREVLLGDDRIPYRDLVIASGARARRLPPEQHLAGVHVLRTVADARALREQARSATAAVVVGGGFIGLEVASTLRDQGLPVTVLEAAERPLARSLDEATAATLVDHAVRTGGVALRCPARLTELRPGPDGRVATVVLADGTELPADLVVVGIGAVPNVEWLDGSGLRTSSAGVHCDRTGRAGPGVWAVGDVSAWATATGNEVERHEHWTSANDQARVVARNIVEDCGRTNDGPSYVWSDQFGLRINIIGNPTEHDEARVLSPDPATLTTLYARQGRFVGACVVGQPRLMAQCRSWAAQRLPVQEVPAWPPASADLTTTRSE